MWFNGAILSLRDHSLWICVWLFSILVCGGVHANDLASLDNAVINHERPLFRSLGHNTLAAIYFRECSGDDNWVQIEIKKIDWVSSLVKIIADDDKAFSYTLFTPKTPNPKTLEALSFARTQVDVGLKTVMKTGSQLPSNLEIYLGSDIPLKKDGDSFASMKNIASRRIRGCRSLPKIVINYDRLVDLGGVANQKVDGQSQISMTIIHEVAHAIHDRNAGRYFWESGNNLVRGQSPLNTPTVDAQTTVSAYAMGNNKEYVAEVFTGDLVGLSNRYPDEVLLHYAALSGPRLTAKTEAKIGKILARGSSTICDQSIARDYTPSAEQWHWLSERLKNIVDVVLDDYHRGFGDTNDWQVSHNQLVMSLYVAIDKRRAEGWKYVTYEDFVQKFIQDSDFILKNRMPDTRYALFQRDMQHAASSLLAPRGTALPSDRYFENCIPRKT